MISSGTRWDVPVATDDDDYTEDCTRCGDNVNRVHPYGWIVLHLSSPVQEDAVVLLCAVCMAEFGEYLQPRLKEDPQWISEKDQLMAEIRERWNR
jgi:hypothetical protein